MTYLAQVLDHPFILLVVALVTYLVRVRLRLNHIPGPFAASLTNLVRRHWVTTGNAHRIHTELHRKYGKVIRVGPNTVLVSDPSAIPSIYRFSEPYEKSEFYDALMPYVDGKAIKDVFATRNEHVHRTMKQPIAAIYSMSNVVSFEPYVDITIKYLFAHLDTRFAMTGDTCDLGLWLRLFASDVMGEITFSRRLGFLEEGGDIGGFLEDNRNFFVDAAPATQMPWLDYFWKRNRLVPKSAKPNPVADFVAARIGERLQLSKLIPQLVNSRDFLSRFIEAKANNPKLGPETIVTWANANIQAGSDTTAMLLSATFHSLLKNPSSLARLRAELDEAVKRGSSETLTWKDAQDLPYLDACVKEAARLYPPISLPLERIIPKTGAEINGYRLPGGARVAMNPWAVHRDRETFGEDAGLWRPERWLSGQEKAKDLSASLLTFGAGHRSCLGKNISYLEVYKLVPSILLRYDIELADPEAELKLENRWFMMPSNFNVKLKLRPINTAS